MEFEKSYVLDTNIILEDIGNVHKISQNGSNLIILPETVIDELDAKKSGFGEINYQAREFGRFLSDATIIDVTTETNPRFGTYTKTRLKADDVIVDIVSMSEYDIKSSEKSIENDRKILTVCELFSDSVTFLSNDVMCRIRATSLGIETDGIAKNLASENVKFHRVIEGFDESLLSKMNHQDITRYVDEHKPENFCYEFRCESGMIKYAYIVNGRIKFIEETDFDKMPVKPINVGQKFAASGMLDDRVDLCMFEAQAGSGKTLMAISSGLQLVKDGKFEKIIYIRNSVESVDKEEEVGFLPGLDPKFLIYNYPLLDTLEFIHNKTRGPKIENLENKSEMERLTELQKHYGVDTMWTGASRGRSISGAYVVIDEVQNFSKSSLRTILTRFDDSCKVVCVGSNRQIDHKYINKYTNGLSKIVEATTKEENELVLFGAVLEKCVRGKITEWTESTFDD